MIFLNRLLRIVHTGYGVTVFALLFLLLFPLLLVPILFHRLHRWVGVINRVWARLIFIFCFFPHEVICRRELDSKRQYIFCPNHFSYLDIPTMGLNPINTVFVGKNDMQNIPLFGFMYRKLHITVDRSRLRSKYSTFVKSREAIDEGKSLVMYPEGGIYAEHPPNMTQFKEGPFRLAIEKQIPIVPVSIPNNWIILPANEFLVRAGKVKVVFHEPIETQSLTLEDTEKLMELVFGIIQHELSTELANRHLRDSKREALPA